jgi:hypothetical protein
MNPTFRKQQLYRSLARLDRETGARTWVSRDTDFRNGARLDSAIEVALLNWVVA